MTKQEVYNNISYNERLVRQYTNQINNLNKEISSYNSQINKYNAQKEQLTKQLNNAAKNIDELNSLLNKVKNLSNTFEQKQQKRLNAMSKNFSIIPNVGFIRSYITGMSNLLSGSEYKNACNGLNTALQNIKKRRQTEDNKYDNIKNDIKDISRKIDTSRSRVASCKAELSEAKNNLSYRKNRIVYWKQQLQYAT